MPEENIGLKGLQKVKVTPLLYLQLMYGLDTKRKVKYNGETLEYNKAQLQMAFSHYLQENKGPWKREQMRNLAGLDKLAVEFVDKQQQKIDKEIQRDQKAGKPEQFLKKKEFALLKELGLLPKEQKKPTEGLKEDKFSRQEKENENFKNILKAENVIDVLSTLGEPTTTVAASLLMIALQSELTDKICEVLLNTYKNDAKNPQEKTVILSALQGVMDEKIRHKLHPFIKELRENEPKESVFHKELHQLEPPHAHEGEILSAPERGGHQISKEDYEHHYETTASKKAQFKEQEEEMTAKRGSYAYVPKQQQGIIMDPYRSVIPTVPRPDLSDPAFGGSGKKRKSDDEDAY